MVFRSITDDDEKSGQTAKGIKKNVIKQELQHDNYEDVLFNNKKMRHIMRLIKSERHQIGSYIVNKISLSCFDDKRYIHENGVTSYAYGHERLKKYLAQGCFYQSNAFKI